MWFLFRLKNIERKLKIMTNDNSRRSSQFKLASNMTSYARPVSRSLASLVMTFKIYVGCISKPSSTYSSIVSVFIVVL